MSGISPDRGCLVVKDTEGLIESTLLIICLHSVVFPAPEGAETINMLPLLFFSNRALPFQKSLRNRLRLQGGEDNMIAVSYDD